MSWSPEPELEPELERDLSSPDSTPDGSPTWWTRDPERSMNERYEVARRKRDTWMTPARSPARLPRDQSPARFLIPQSPVRNSHERSPTRMPRARSHARITSDLDYDIESDDEANVSGSMAASPITEISPQFDPAGAVVGGGGDDGIYGGGNDDINKIDVCPICYEPWTCDGRHQTWYDMSFVNTLLLIIYIVSKQMWTSITVMCTVHLQLYVLLNSKINLSLCSLL